MPAFNGQVGFEATIYMSTHLPTKTLTLVEAAVTTANKLNKAYDVGPLTKERDIIDVNEYGNDTIGKVTGAADPGTWDFILAPLDMADAQHIAIRDDAGTTLRTFIIVYGKDANITYGAYDGYIATADIEQSFDDVIKLNVTIARSGAITFLDKA